MKLRLAAFPDQVLAIICSHLPTLNLAQLVYLSGDAIIKNKALHCVDTIYMGRLSVPLLGLVFLKDFRSLRCLTLNCRPSLFLLDEHLQHLPPTLRELNIMNSCSTWLHTGAKSARALSPLHYPFLESNRLPFNFKLVTPHLERLHLECTQSVCSNATSSMMCYFVGCCLPSSIRKLSISHFDQLHLIYDILAKREWDITPLEHAVKPNKFASLEASKLITSLPHLIIESTLTNFPSELIQLRNISVSLWIEGPQNDSNFADLLALFAKHRPSNYSKSNSGASSNKPRLVSLAISPVTTGVGGQIQWPDTLHTLRYNDIFYMTHYSWEPSLLPRSLTSYYGGLSIKESTIKSLPPNLTSLTFRPGDAFGSSALSLLPSTLTELRILYYIGTFNEEIASSLPRNLRIFSFNHKTPSGLITASFARNLPPSLTCFTANYECTDSVLMEFPKTVTSFELARLIISGYIFPKSAQSLTLPSMIALQRYADGTLCLNRRFRLWDEIGTTAALSSLSYELVTLPSSLTQLRVELQISTFTAKLPNLTHLTLASIDSIDWVQSELPRLTSLSTMLTCVLPEILWPAGLTYYETYGVLNSLPTQLLPQLRKLKALSMKSAFIKQHLSSLRLVSLSIGSDLTVLFWDALPQSLTELTVNSVWTDALQLKRVPNLTSITLLCPLLQTSLDQLPSTVRALKCPSISLAAPYPISNASEDYLDGGEFNLEKALLKQLQTKFPALLASPDAQVRCESLPHSFALEVIAKLPAEKWQRFSITGSPAIWPRLATCFPSTIQTIDAPLATGWHSGSLASLPTSLTELSIDFSKLTIEAYRSLPQTITKLGIKTMDFRVRHAEAILHLPLKTLRIDTVTREVKTLSQLAPTLTSLTLSTLLPKDTLSWLPSSITKLHIGKCSFATIGGLPPSITEFSRGDEEQNGAVKKAAIAQSEGLLLERLQTLITLSDTEEQ